MKTHIKNLFPCLGVASRESRVLPALLAGLGLMLAMPAAAQTFTTLYGFTASPTNSSGISTNSDGATPYAGVILSGNTLFGTATYGGTNGSGTVFAANTTGTGFTNLHTFTALSDSLTGTNSDGANPIAGLILSGNTLYGTAAHGGNNGSGTVFAVNTDGTGFTNLHTFTAFDPTYYTNSDGAYPNGLILSGNTLYGTASEGGSAGNGTVFAINTNGTGFTNLYSFTAVTDNGNGVYTNSDGDSPRAGLILSGNTLYGTTYGGGGADNGTIFAVNTNGGGFKNLHSFSASGTYNTYYSTNGDGANPVAGLILYGNTLYGTAPNGGTNGNGTVFAVNNSGTAFTTLHSFTTLSIGPPFPQTNSDGGYPQAGLVLSGNTLYGTANSGGSSGEGTVFAVNTDGTGFRTVYGFTAVSTNSSGVYTNSDGDAPYGGLFLSGGSLYGTASQGGSSGNGTVFSLFIPPQLTITRSGTNVFLTWPSNYTGYTLEWATNLVSPIAWNANLMTGQAVIGDQNVVTNPITGAQMYYRLALGQKISPSLIAARSAMKAAGATSYGHRYSLWSGPLVSDDMFYLPVPTSVIELVNANPTRFVVTISTSSGPAPGYGCAEDKWEGFVGPQSVHSTVIVLIGSGTTGACQSGYGPYQGF